MVRDVLSKMSEISDLNSPTQLRDGNEASGKREIYPRSLSKQVSKPAEVPDLLSLPWPISAAVPHAK